MFKWVLTLDVILVNGHTLTICLLAMTTFNFLRALFNKFAKSLTLLWITSFGFNFFLGDIIEDLDFNIFVYSSFTFANQPLDTIGILLILFLWHETCLLRFDGHYSRTHVWSSTLISIVQVGTVTWQSFQNGKQSYLLFVQTQLEDFFCNNYLIHGIFGRKGQPICWPLFPLDSSRIPLNKKGLTLPLLEWDSLYKEQPLINMKQIMNSTFMKWLCKLWGDQLS